MKYNLLEILQVEFYHSYYLILFVSFLEKKNKMSRVFDISRKTSVILLNCNSHAVTLHFFINRTKLFTREKYVGNKNILIIDDVTKTITNITFIWVVKYFANNKL